MLLAHVADLPYPGALLGVDAGSKRTGIAISDPAQRIASPLTTLRRKSHHGKDFLDLLIQLYHTRQCVGMVTGLPLNMDGSEGPQAQSIRSLCQNLHATGHMPIAMWDERLSSQAARRALLDANTSRAKRTVRIDSIAACIILQTALDYLVTTRP